MVLQDVVEASGMEESEALWVMRFLEEVMTWPEHLHRKLFFERLARKEKAMEFTTCAERVGEKRGIKKGELKNQKANVLQLLQMRFKRAPQRITDKGEESCDGKDRRAGVRLACLY